MTGGELKIEVLPAGAVVPAFGLLDAVSRARWTAATACWSTTTASRTRSRCGVRARPSAWTRTCCSPGTSTAAARSCSTSSTPRSAATSSRSCTARCRPSRSAGSRSRSPRSRTSRASSSAPSASRSTCSPAMGAAVNALPGGEIVPAMDRGLLDAAEFNNATSRPRARLPGRLQGLHAAELPPERRAVRDHVQQDQVRRAAGEDEVHHRQRGGGGLGRHVLEGDRPLLEGLHRAAERTASSSTRRRTPCCRPSSTLWDDVIAKKGEQRALQGDRGVAEGVRRARGQVGPRTPTSAVAWPTTTTSARKAGEPEEGLILVAA